MLLFDRRSLILLPLALAACGFTPVHAPGGTGSRLYGQIVIQEPKKEDAYRLTRNLEQRLGRTASGSYALAYKLTTEEEGQAITITGETTRYSIVGEVSYTLTRVSDSAVLAKGKTSNFTGYSAQGSTVDVLSGERDAHERLMVILADQMTADILSTTVPDA